MPLHHLGRWVAVIVGVWTGGGFYILSQLGFVWQHKWDRSVGSAAHFIESFAPRQSSRVGARSESGLPVGTSTTGCVASSGASTISAFTPIRSASAIQFLARPQAGLVSVVIPTHNRARIIGRAIESALGQTYPDVDVIVADDGSSDDTPEVIEAFGPRITYVRQPNRGVSAARNFGMRYARGEFIAFLDSDDTWSFWKIAAQVEALRRHPDAGVVWTDMSAVDEDEHLIDSRHLRIMYSAYSTVDIEDKLPQVGKLSDLNSSVPPELLSVPVREGDLSGAILLGNLIHTSTVLFRRSLCEKTGGFDESFARAGEDYEFYIRLCSGGPVVFIDAPSMQYRVGAADQLTAPAMLLEIARNDLRAVRKWMPPPGSPEAVPRSVMRRRLAESFAWVGEAELQAGNRLLAAKRLAKSLVILPGTDRRAILLASCVLPSPARESLRKAKSRLLRVNAS